MKKVITLSNHEVEVIDFSKLVTETVPAGEKKEEVKKPAGKVAAPRDKKEEAKQDVH